MTGLSHASSPGVTRRCTAPTLDPCSLVRTSARSDPLAAAEAEGADAVQIFLGNPQSWKAPKPRADAARLRESPLPIYVHAPYLINVASPNNRVRIPSRKILQQTCDAAADIEATAVIVHGGHHADDDDLQAGFQRWRKALEQLADHGPRLPGEHRRRRPRDRPPVRHDRPPVGLHRRQGHRLLPRHVPRVGRRRRADRRGRADQVHHRPHRPGALQRLQGPAGFGP